MVYQKIKNLLDKSTEQTSLNLEYKTGFTIMMMHMELIRQKVRLSPKL